jgi:hypothetical protein
MGPEKSCDFSLCNTNGLDLLLLLLLLLLLGVRGKPRMYRSLLAYCTARLPTRSAL